MNSFQQNVIKHKIDLLNLAAELGNVSRACTVMKWYPQKLDRLLSSVMDNTEDHSDEQETHTIFQ